VAFEHDDVADGPGKLLPSVVNEGTVTVSCLVLGVKAYPMLAPDVQKED